MFLLLISCSSKWHVSIHYKINVTLNNGAWSIRFTHFNTGSISFKTWYIYCDQAKDVYMSRLQVFSICPTIGPLNQVISFHFIKSYRRPILTPHFLSWLASQRPFMTGFKISELDHFKKSFVLYYWKKKWNLHVDQKLALYKIYFNIVGVIICVILKFYYFFDCE